MSIVVTMKPLDTLFFRTGRPFTGGDESWGEVFFPPLPSTIYGALRSWLIVERGGFDKFLQGAFTEELGTKDSYGALDVKGPFILKGREPIFVLPRDVVIAEGDSKEPAFFLLSLVRRKVFMSDDDMEMCLMFKGDGKVESKNWWISQDAFKRYLKGEEFENGCLKWNVKMNDIFRGEEIYTEEPKIGIARDTNTRTSRESYIYTIPLIRLRDDVEFAAEIDGLKASVPQNGIFKLGGESRPATVECISEDIFEGIKNLRCDISNGYFKVVLLTPAVFKKGWLPDWVDEKSLEGEVKDFGIRVKLVACALGRPVVIGGWNIRGKAPKPVIKAVPAGSVFYFKLLDGKIERVFDMFHWKCISDQIKDQQLEVDYVKEGFGLSVVGSVKNLKGGDSGV